MKKKLTIGDLLAFRKPMINPYEWAPTATGGNEIAANGNTVPQPASDSEAMLAYARLVREPTEGAPTPLAEDERRRMLEERERVLRHVAEMRDRMVRVDTHLDPTTRRIADTITDARHRMEQDILRRTQEINHERMQEWQRFVTRDLQRPATGARWTGARWSGATTTETTSIPTITASTDTVTFRRDGATMWFDGPMPRLTREEEIE